MDSIQVISGLPGVPSYLIEQLKPKKKSTALVIPVINEGSRIFNQLRKIEKISPEVDIIIVDGGSTDHSLDTFREDGKILTAILTNKDVGKLSAQLKASIHYCLTMEYESVITMDGNDKDDASDIVKFQKALSEGYDFIQGSRFIKGGIALNTPKSRYFAIRLVHAPITSIAARRWFTDTTNGFRGFSKKFIVESRARILDDSLQNYELVALLPVLAGRSGYLCKEVPVSRAYPRKGVIPTKINGMRGNIDLLMTLLRITLQSRK